jgi:assimilatory nitrate reductase catalytic subunit
MTEPPDEDFPLLLNTGRTVEHRHTRTKTGRARVTATIRAGEVFVPFHYDEQCVNRLTRDEYDPISREPNYKQCAVRVSRS